MPSAIDLLLARPQRRIVPTAQVRIAPQDNVPGFSARVMNYGRVDDYRTMFDPGVFTESMNQRLPRVCWSHDWADPIGRWVAWQENSAFLDMDAELDDFEAVPRARQAYAQVKSGTIDQFSVGFMPLDAEIRIVDGEEIIVFTRARLDEVSLVLVGAVPDTETLAIRSFDRPFVVGFRAPAPLVVDRTTVEKILIAVSQGDMDLADALGQIKEYTQVLPELSSTNEPGDELDPVLGPEAGSEPEPEPEVETASEEELDEMDAAAAELAAFFDGLPAI